MIHGYEDMPWGMMGAMGLFWLLILALVVLSIAALVKYLKAGK